MKDELVLVTGGTGYIAQFCILALLDAGYRVRTTLRTPQRQAEVLANLKVGGAEPGERLSFVVADLTADAGWDDAVAGCSFVMHGASPTPTGEHITEDDWVKPAVEGNLRVLRAARDAGVKRVVLTSAFGAIGVGHPPMQRPFNETDWSDLNSRYPVAPYQRSKTLSERAAWDFIAREGKGMELAAINPVAVLGPVLGADYSHSVRLVKQMLDGQQGSPKINSGFVDVRDVADLHLLAMTHPSAKGERFVAITGHSVGLIDVARILRRRLGKAARKTPTFVLPNWAVKLAARKNPSLRGLIPLLGINLNATSEKAQRLLGWSPRSLEDAVVATGESLIEHKLVNV
ncbi:SDR family oxidoreductase [Saccharospirillum mangrovi]|uniref:SDR family oxidoreductase n=1 Tax=Saccharospirillum mangrovi TaxID=2161747 RepID=UPI000D359218|nr:aldehyde reductase [Saccharospirillum mangrovi]